MSKGKGCCHCLCECFRSIPFGAIISASISLLGLLLCILRLGKVKEGLEAFGNGAQDYDKIHQFVAIPFLLVFLTVGLGLVLSFIAAGKTRECIYGRAKQGCCMKCLTCLVGPCMVSMTMFLCVVSFLIQLIFSYVFLVVFIIMTMMNGICEGGTKAQEDAGNLFQDLGSTVQADLKTFCVISEDGSKATFVMFFGLVLTVIGQFFMCAVLSSDLSRIMSEYEKAKAVDEATEGGHKP